MRIHFIGLSVVVIALCACGKEKPAGTKVVDWSYTSPGDVDPIPKPLTPARTVTREASWPIAKGPPVRLRFETEIGEQLVGGMHWHTPMRVRISLAAPTRAELPRVDCMPAPPGNQLRNGRVVPPLASDGSTALGKVACFFLSHQPESSVFDIDGEGRVTRSIATKPRR